MSEDEEEIRRLLRKLEESYIEKKISEETYRELKEKYEEKLRKIIEPARPKEVAAVPSQPKPVVKPGKINLGENINESLGFPLRNYGRTVLLGVLVILSFLIIPAFLALGYLLRNIRSVGVSDKPVEYGDWGNMLVDGLKVFAVSIVYFIVPAIIGYVFSSGVLRWRYYVGISAPMYRFTPSFYTSFLAVFLVIAVAGFFFYLFYAMAIANMAFKGYFSAAFEFNEIIGRIESVGVVNYIAWGIAAYIIALVISFIGAIIPVLGVILIVPIAYLFMARSLGHVYRATVHGGA